MEIDGALPAIALALSVLCFSAVSLAEASLASIRRERVHRLITTGVSEPAPLERLYSLPNGATGALSLMRAFFLSSGILSALALVIVLMDVHWLAISLVFLAALVLVTVVHIGAGALGSAYGQQVVLTTEGPVRLLARLLHPLVAAEERLLQGFRRLRRRQGEAGPGLISTQGTMPLDPVDEPLDEREVRMIRGVVRLDKTTAREIMVPRVDMVAAEIGTLIAQLAEQMVKGGHSRIPIYTDNLDHIAGIAYARDVLSHLVHDKDPSATLVESLVRPALFIPEAKTLEELLNEFQQTRVHMAIVVDEYGGVSGIVTIEDLLEEIVGEIQDEFDVGETEIEAVKNNEFVMDARVSIDQVNELLSVSVEGDGFDSLGGFVFHELGKIPSPGDCVEYNGLRIDVLSTVGRRIKRLRVTKTGGSGLGPR